MKIPSILAGLMTASVFSCLHAQTTDAPPVDANSVLSKLDQIKHKQEAEIKSTEKTLAQTLMTTASSPSAALNYYMAAVIATRFSGQNHEAKEAEDWKKSHEAELKDPTFQSALCLHLMYLSLTVSHDSGAKAKDLLPSLLTYIQQVQAYEANLEARSARQGAANTQQGQPNGNYQGRNGGRNNPYGQQAQQAQANETDSTAQKGLMETPLAKSIFVKYLEIGQYVTDDETWEQTPIEIDGIYQKVILPEYRLEKNTAGIFQYWDARIQKEEADANSMRHQVDIDKFNKVTKPSLQWQRAEEYVGLGLKNTAINAMVSIIDANRYHPDTHTWIEEVEKLIKEPSTPAASQTPATSAAPVTPPVAPVVANPNPTQPAQN